MAGNWLEKLEGGKIVLIDGATGTELQRRGAPMDGVAWSGAAVLTHGDLLRQTHEDYIRAGAEVIITNTFGTTRQMLAPAGLGDKVVEINRRAVQLALEARDNVAESPVAVAGSISAMPPRFDRGDYPEPEEEIQSYCEVAQVLAETGVDLIALEMMEETVHAPRAVRAALETGLPVWLGLSCRREPEGGAIKTFDRPGMDFGDLLDALVARGLAVVNLMHSEVNAIPEAIGMVQQRWKGPIGVYPESGYFKSPNWNFVNVISPEDLVEKARKWVSAGVRLLGGCCGTSPAHIEALRDALPTFSTG